MSESAAPVAVEASPKGQKRKPKSELEKLGDVSKDEVELTTTGRPSRNAAKGVVYKPPTPKRKEGIKRTKREKDVQEEKAENGVPEDAPKDAEKPDEEKSDEKADDEKPTDAADALETAADTPTETPAAASEDATEGGEDAVPATEEAKAE